MVSNNGSFALKVYHIAEETLGVPIIFPYKPEVTGREALDLLERLEGGDEEGIEDYLNIPGSPSEVLGIDLDDWYSLVDWRGRINLENVVNTFRKVYNK